MVPCRGVLHKKIFLGPACGRHGHEKRLHQSPGREIVHIDSPSTDSYHIAAYSSQCGWRGWEGQRTACRRALCIDYDAHLILRDGLLSQRAMDWFTVQEGSCTDQQPETVCSWRLEQGNGVLKSDTDLMSLQGKHTSQGQARSFYTPIKRTQALRCCAYA